MTGLEVPIFFLHILGFPIALFCIFIWRRGREKNWPWQGILGVILATSFSAFYIGYAIPQYSEFTAIWLVLDFILWVNAIILGLGAAHIAHWIVNETRKAKRIKDTTGAWAYVFAWGAIGFLVGLVLWVRPSVFTSVMSGWMWAIGRVEGTGTGERDLVWNSSTIATWGWWLYGTAAIILYTAIYYAYTRTGKRRRRTVGAPLIITILFVSMALLIFSMNIFNGFLAFGREFLGLDFSLNPFDWFDLGSVDLSNLEFPDFSGIAPEELNLPTPVVEIGDWWQNIPGIPQIP